MENLKDYLKYYWLETEYLEKEVRSFFERKKHLEPEHFFAIIIWKANRKKTLIKDALIKQKKNIEDITGKIYEKIGDKRGQLDLLLDIDHIGIPIASAILAICFPNEFTIADYRSCNSLAKPPFNVKNFSYSDFQSKGKKNRELYIEYVAMCKKFVPRYASSLRELDQTLWGMDFYDGKNGLTELVEKYRDKQLEPIRTKKT